MPIGRQSHLSLEPRSHTMSLKAAHDLSISELLNELSEKLGLESTRLRETYLPPGVSVASLKAEVSTIVHGTHDRSILDRD